MAIGFEGIFCSYEKNKKKQFNWVYFRVCFDLIRCLIISEILCILQSHSLMIAPIERGGASVSVRPSPLEKGIFYLRGPNPFLYVEGLLSPFGEPCFSFRGYFLYLKGGGGLFSLCGENLRLIVPTHKNFCGRPYFDC